MLVSLQPPIPLPIWDILASVAVELLASLVVGVLAYLFFGRRPRAASWNERKDAINEQIRVRLRQMIQAQEQLSADEEIDDPTEKRLTDAERTRWGNQSGKAYEALQAILQEYRYLLAPRVSEILQTLFRRVNSDEVADTTAPQTVFLVLANDAHRDLVEFLPADVGPAQGVQWRVQRLRRWLWRQWWRLKGWAGGVLWRLDTWTENLGIMTGPQLTQDNVRNPPRTGVWQTVEEMNKLGLTRVMIQRRASGAARSRSASLAAHTHATRPCQVEPS